MDDGTTSLRIVDIATCEACLRPEIATEHQCREPEPVIETPTPQRHDWRTCGCDYCFESRYYANAQAEASYPEPWSA